MKKQVAIERCRDYSPGTLREALERVLGRLGGMGAFVQPGQEVLLKPNLLRRAKPEEGVTTHPAVVRAVAEFVQAAGGKVTIGDSPGAALAHNRNTLIKLYRACGLEQVAEETGAELALETEYETVSLPEGRLVKKIEVIRPALSADVIINLPKFKTHVYTRLTGAVKNLFGLVPGLIKPAYHAKLCDVVHFSSMLVDIAEFARSSLSIVDGVVAMEGDGPGSGPLRKTGLIVAGASPPAVDAILGKIAGIDPLSVPTIRECVERGFIEKDLSDIEVGGLALADAVQKGMSVPLPVERGISFATLPFWARPFLPLIKPLFTDRPRIRRRDCRLCGDCVRVCPVKAIRMKEGRVTIDYASCIRCYCCHETCPDKAIELVKPLFRRFFI
jgi:uncharacterized protein (DUF362 family)/Pyruvate/2-oxoacid:ferredoxin oxidoreductase delta subunit